MSRRAARIARCARQSIFEIALAVVLTLGAGLLFNSYMRLMMVDTGLRTDGVLAVVTPLSGKQYPDGASNLALFRRVIERIVDTRPPVMSATTPGRFESSSAPPLPNS